MDSLSIAIRSINRNIYNKKNYIEETITSILESDVYNHSKFKGINIFSSFVKNNEHLENKIIKENCRVFIPEKELNPNETALWMMKETIKDDNSHILLCEDDIEFCVNWFDYLLKWKRKYNKNDDIPIMTLYSPYDHVDILYKLDCSRYWEYHVKDFYGSQCVLLHKFYVKMFINFMEKYRTCLDSYSWKSKKLKKITEDNLVFRGFDFWIAEANIYINPMIDYVYSVIPCLVQHIGVESGMECKLHTAKGYYGKYQQFKKLV
jgi:hypothetical protein